MARDAHDAFQCGLGISYVVENKGLPIEQVECLERACRPVGVLVIRSYRRTMHCIRRSQVTWGEERPYESDGCVCEEKQKETCRSRLGSRPQERRSPAHSAEDISTLIVFDGSRGAIAGKFCSTVRPAAAVVARCCAGRAMAYNLLANVTLRFAILHRDRETVASKRVMVLLPAPGISMQELVVLAVTLSCRRRQLTPSLPRHTTAEPPRVLVTSETRAGVPDVPPSSVPRSR